MSELCRLDVPEGAAWRLGVLDESEIVVAGLAALLARPGADGTAPPIEVVDLRGDLTDDVDLLLVDPRHLFGRGAALSGRLDDRGAGVVAFAWQLERGQVAALVERGAAGCLTKRLGGVELTSSLEALRRGETVVRTVVGDGESGVATHRDLSGREREVLGLVAEGLTNQEIAERIFVSINSVKTFIRTAYRKIGATTRPQAVAWQLRSRD